MYTLRLGGAVIMLQAKFDAGMGCLEGRGGGGGREVTQLIGSLVTVHWSDNLNTWVSDH